MSTGGFENFRQSLKATSPALAWDERPETLAAYSRDESCGTSGKVQAVLFPSSTAEVSSICKYASTHGIVLVPRGAGSGLSGAAVPTRPTVVLSLERMKRIVEIDEANFCAWVEPGVITGEFRRTVEGRGLFYPPIPASADFCTLGGNVATNAGGLCVVKYGATRKHVMGLEAVLMDGTVIHTGGKFMKHTSGYELTQLLVGSEGTLAIFTKILLALLPLPSQRATLLCPFASLAQVGQAVVKILQQGLSVSTMEVMPKSAVDCVLKDAPDLPFPFPQEAATLLLEVDGFDEAVVMGTMEKLAEVISPLASGESLLAASPAQREQLWGLRKRIRDSVARAEDFVEADAVVPRAKLPELIEAGEQIRRRYQVPVISYGHAGDGNLHTYFQRGEFTKDYWDRIKHEVLQDFFNQVLAMGGAVSGEHGVGLLKRDYLAQALPAGNLALMQRLKRTFDPQNLLNPDKVISLE